MADLDRSTVTGGVEKCNTPKPTLTGAVKRRTICPHSSAVARPFGDRLMVGQQPLKLFIQVRALVPEPHKNSRST